MTNIQRTGLTGLVLPHFTAIVPVCVAVALGGCGDAIEPDASALTGTWVATSAIVTNPANSENVDIVAGGLSLTLVIAEDRGLRLTIGTGEDAETSTGYIETAGARITLVIDGDRSEGAWLLDGDTLTLDLHTGIEWDFEGNGLDVPVTMAVTLVRQ